MALRYAWFDSYGSVGYVLTLHISPPYILPMAEGRGGVRATIAMAPRAAGRVGDVSHAARAAARLARGMNWLETERRASLMRSRRALGPAPSALIWHVWGGFHAAGA